MPVVFIHGGGDNAYAFDADIVHRLREAVSKHVTIDYPRVPGLERIQWSGTFQQLSEIVSTASPSTTLVAHSIGAAAILKVLSIVEGAGIRNVFLLAAPYKGADSHWGRDDFTFPSDFSERLRRFPIAMYHSKDDDVIPVEDALSYKSSLPSANIEILNGYGHQFTLPLDFLADAIRAAA